MKTLTEDIAQAPEEKIPQNTQGSVGWDSPSNIALIKYWGKKDMQIPCNPSISFTLKNAKTSTQLDYQNKLGEKPQVKLFLDQEEKPNFIPKIQQFLERIKPLCSFVGEFDFTIHSSNTFPHSAGIASSASGMSALALCICSIEQSLFNTLQSDKAFYQKASYLARLGSGSACRSLYGGIVSWGETTSIFESSDLYGSNISENVHDVFKNYRDTILIVDEAEKKVSSTVGHGLMDKNPFSEKRFEQAHANLDNILPIMKSGEENDFLSIVESEALSLHAMMMTSDPYFLLMRPNTLNIIEKIFAFRNETNIPVGFTLDAGPNVHLLYAQKNETEINKFINAELKQFLHDFCYLSDEVGQGPVKKAL